MVVNSFLADYLNALPPWDGVSRVEERLNRPASREKYMEHDWLIGPEEHEDVCKRCGTWWPGARAWNQKPLPCVERDLDPVGPPGRGFSEETR